MTVTPTYTLGFPRIGRDREMKLALEAYWKHKTDEAALLRVLAEVERQAADAQAGIDLVGVGDTTLYDHVLDWAFRLGIVPARFRHLEGLELRFAMARGADGIQPLELTKWFDTNYHYLVPEVAEDWEPAADFADFLESVRAAQERLNARAVPIVLGPVSLLALSRLALPLGEALERALPAYQSLLRQLAGLGVAEVQLHEPALALGRARQWEQSYQFALEALSAVGVPLNLVTYFDDLGEAYPWAVQLPAAALSLDFTRGDNLALIRRYRWPERLALGAGVVDGRNVWRIRPDEVLPVLRELAEAAPALRVGPSCSLMFVPYRAAREDRLPPALRGVLAFADEKLAEVTLLARALNGEPAEPELQQARQAWSALAEAVRLGAQVAASLTSRDFTRSSPYSLRRPAQIQLPPLPTTTIGSFPQTAAVRSLRARYKRGEIDPETYQAGIDAWIGYTIGAQDGLGLDVLVHGEFERSDMVEYFAEKLDGFAFTEHGWVQSYGNRYVRPPIIWGDVVRPQPMTVREFQKAQSFTTRPVKGMLTGPVTILNWSFVRSDIPRREVAFQLALALRQEIEDLEAAGARVIQVDEPALREGLPLKPQRWQEYLDWAVDAFRLATAGARDATQVHTHMCYADFGDVLAAIERMDADVISIENTRSGDANLEYLATAAYPREVGPGVYDVHSANIPAAEQIKARLQVFLSHLRPEQIWVNPDCGLKTRAWEDVLPSLTHIVEAVRELRRELAVQPEGVPAGEPLDA
jgi:5-methyltetrahydropteroyltriglutamate--homocysteine methyltransferase